MSMADLAAAYLQDAADVFGIDAEIVAKPDARFDDDKSRLVLVEEKSLMGATTAGFAQHVGALQIWEAGASVTMQEKPAQVVSAQSQYRRDVKVDRIDGRPRIDPAKPSLTVLAKVLGLENAKQFGLKINGPGRWWLYRYDPEQRHHLEAVRGESKRGGRASGPPTLDLPEVDPKLEPGVHYPVAEVLFRLALPLWGPLNWRAFVEPVTGSVLYIRAFVACATGRVYRTDPTVQSGSLTLARERRNDRRPRRSAQQRHARRSRRADRRQPGAARRVRRHSGHEHADRRAADDDVAVRLRLLVAVGQLRGCGDLLSRGRLLPTRARSRLHHRHVLQQHDVPRAGRSSRPLGRQRELRGEHGRQRRRSLPLRSLRHRHDGGDGLRGPDRLPRVRARAALGQRQLAELRLRAQRGRQPGDDRDRSAHGAHGLESLHRLHVLPAVAVFAGSPRRQAPGGRLGLGRRAGHERLSERGDPDDDAVSRVPLPRRGLAAAGHAGVRIAIRVLPHHQGDRIARYLAGDADARAGQLRRRA